MNRRSFLQGFGLTVAAALAGCGTAGPAATDAPGESPTPPGTPAVTATESPIPTAEQTAPGTATTSAGTEAPGSPATTAGGEIVEVSAGPEGRLRFRPETVEISAGDTVRWTFDSPGHNVTTLPGSSEKVTIPEGAELFASYEGDQHFAINEVGTTFEHTFTVPGEYVYVCAPHEDQGMVGTVVVSE